MAKDKEPGTVAPGDPSSSPPAPNAPTGTGGPTGQTAVVPVVPQPQGQQGKPKPAEGPLPQAHEKVTVNGQEVRQALGNANAIEQPHPKIDETIPGGKFIVGMGLKTPGMLVNNAGQPINDQGKVINPTPGAAPGTGEETGERPIMYADVRELERTQPEPGEPLAPPV